MAEKQRFVAVDQTMIIYYFFLVCFFIVYTILSVIAILRQCAKRTVFCSKSNFTVIKSQILSCSSFLYQLLCLTLYHLFGREARKEKHKLWRTLTRLVNNWTLLAYYMSLNMHMEEQMNCSAQKVVYVQEVKISNNDANIDPLLFDMVSEDPEIKHFNISNGVYHV